MFGVVLWSDTEEKKAVIWCEDHGDLAFYRQGVDDKKLVLEAGDLVRFDMTMDRRFRYACNPCLVSGDYHSEIADVLVSSTETGTVCTGETALSGVAVQRMARSERLSAQIIPFCPNAGRRAGSAGRAAALRG